MANNRVIYRFSVKPLKNAETTFYTENVETALSSAHSLDQNGQLLDRFEIQRVEEIPDGAKLF